MVMHMFQFMFVEGTQQMQLPSLMAHRLLGIMDVFRQLESYVTLDTSRIFNVVLLQHTQVHTQALSHVARHVRGWPCISRRRAAAGSARRRALITGLRLPAQERSAAAS